MQITPYLTFNGTCREALHFYASCLAGSIEVLQSFGETPMAGDFPSDLHDRVMHARLAGPGWILFASDSPAEERTGGDQVSLSLHLEEPKEAERIFTALSAGGQITMPMQKTFWAERFGMLTDRFGIAWLVNCASEA